MTDDLRDALRRYAEPADPPPGARDQIISVMIRRRRRRAMLASGAAAVTVVVLAAGLTAYGTAGDSTDPAAPTVTPSSGTPSPPPVETAVEARTDRWSQIASAPLTPRHDAVGVWTGSEVVVAGGSTSPPCSPLARCVERSDDVRADGAAYDPVTDTWRPIADAPARFAGAQAVWSGAELIVVTASAVFAYDPADDTWRTMQPPTRVSEPTPPVLTDEGIVFVSYDQTPNSEPTDQVLDPITGTWTDLPSDPFGESYDRSMAWDGERLWLMSMAVEEHFGAFDGSVSRLAVLEGGLTDGTWRVVDDETPTVFQRQVVWWGGTRLVVPPSPYGPEGALALTFDPLDQVWGQVNVEQPGQGCQVPRVGPGPAWIADGPSVTAIDGSRSALIPECPSLPDPDVSVWIGTKLLLWGGPNTEYDANTGIGLLWAPPT